MNKTLSFIAKNAIYVAIAVQVLILSNTLIGRWYTYQFGKEITLKVEPYDPRDIFYGDYVQLRYEINHFNIQTNKNQPLLYDYPDGTIVYAQLTESDGNWKVSNVSKNPPSNGVYIKGKTRDAYGNNLEIEYGIEKYYVEENTGRTIQEKLNGRQNTQPAKMVIKVDRFGNAVIKDLLL